MNRRDMIAYFLQIYCRPIYNYSDKSSLQLQTQNVEIGLHWTELTLPHFSKGCLLISRNF